MKRLREKVIGVIIAMVVLIGSVCSIAEGARMYAPENAPVKLQNTLPIALWET